MKSHQHLLQFLLWRFNHIRLLLLCQFGSVVAMNVLHPEPCILLHVGSPEIHDHVLVAKHSAAIGYHYVIIVTIQYLLHGMLHAGLINCPFLGSLCLCWLQPRPNQSALLETQELQHIHILSRHFCIFIRMNISYGRNSKSFRYFLRILMLSHRQFQRNCLFLNDWLLNEP
jgi:hypothetical protein